MDLPSLSPAIQPDSSTNETKRICIIGAGPAGLAALKIILDSPQYKAGHWKPTAFEARSDIGGVWQPKLPTDDPPITPLYDSLTTNIPHPIMAFTSYSFPPSTPLFPHATIVKKYLDLYADHFHLRPYIQLRTAVLAVKRIGPTWEVAISTGERLQFDLVFVCNGHYHIPRYPNIPGIAQWLNSGKAFHSAWYRRPDSFGNTVLVIGAGPSGNDISSELRNVTDTVIRSIPDGAREDTGNLKLRGRVSEFGDNGQVTFEDGTTESGITRCILATGYEYSFPFLSSELVRSDIPPQVPPLPAELYNSTYNVFPLAKHMFPLQTAFPPETLVFLGLLTRVAPFPVIEAQTRAALHAFANPTYLNLPRESVDIITRYEQLRSQVGDDQLLISKAWHRFKTLEQYEYRDELDEFQLTDMDAIWERQNGKVPAWEKRYYYLKDILRKAWVALEESGEAEEWVRGVGENGPHEWIDLMERVLKWAEENKIQVGEEDKSKL